MVIPALHHLTPLSILCPLGYGLLQIGLCLTCTASLHPVSHPSDSLAGGRHSGTLLEGGSEGVRKTMDGLCPLCRVTHLVGDSSRIRQARAPLQCPGKLSILLVPAGSACQAGEVLGLPWEMRGVRQTTVGFQQESPKSPHVNPNGCSTVVRSQQLRMQKVHGRLSRCGEMGLEVTHSPRA